ncbi:hypothetical protein LTR84_012354 [Exophiala bonariae]|uniref:Uncharacterized protein n=1 Tax=Exophiala bonariae TaxID=1690606 RepID=A0AAV9NFY2_9EURO|nr:hypothetical protein LTR84_012354 [Exophiala bonariae]
MSVCLKYLNYFKRQDHNNIDYQNENTPFIDSRVEVLLSHGPITFRDSVDCVTIADEVEQFLGGDDADEFSLEAAGLAQFCTASNVKPAQSDQAATPPYVALLDEKSLVGTQTQSRPYPGPLTADELYKLLKRPRFRHRRRVHSNKANSSTPSDLQLTSQDPQRHLGQAPDNDKFCVPSPTFQLGPVTSRSDLEAESKEPDADRRIIFVTDLDSSTALALIRTVSGNHAAALRDALCNYLAAESIMRSSITKGLVMFKLSFHLPFLALRSSPTPHTDHRLYDGEMRLRNTKDISFLNWYHRDSAKSTQLHEAQVSCVVSGFHDRCWVAHCFVDTYHDGDDQSKECVNDYHEQSLLPQGMTPDAPTMGNLDCDQPIWDPREYFIHIVYFRLMKARSEWATIIRAVRDSFRRYSRSYDESLLSQETHHSKGENQYDRNTHQQNFNLRTQFLLLFSELDECLTRTIDSYEAFRTHSMDFFVDLQQTAGGSASITGIDSIFEELKSLKKKIGYMEHEGQRMKDALELILTREDFKTNKEQSRLVGYMMPIATTTSFFSMQKNLPFSQANFAWFLAFLGIFSLMAFGSRIFRAAVRTLSRTEKTIGENGSFWKHLNLRARRRKNRRIDDIENGSQPSSNGIDEGTPHCEASSSHKPQSAFSSGMSTPPSTFIASHNQSKEIVPRISHLARNQETLT